jgi:hypothetical protein
MDRCDAMKYMLSGVAVIANQGFADIHTFNDTLVGFNVVLTPTITRAAICKQKGLLGNTLWSPSSGKILATMPPGRDMQASFHR